jgi:TRAP transporter TAXI family solute receptor
MRMPCSLRFFRFVLLILPALIFFLLEAATPVHALKQFRIGTGGSTGVYYPIGKQIATGITIHAEHQNSLLHGTIAIAQNSAGSIENARMVSNGELEAGLVQADIASYAFKNVRDFSETPNSVKLRAIASLYSEKFQMVVRNDAEIRSFKDLKGKRISVDEPGSGTRLVTDIVLAEYALTEDDLLPQYLKPAFTEDKMKDGQLQGFAMMAGTPMVAVTKLQPVGVSLLAIDPVVAHRINKKYPYLTPGTIAKDIYHGIPETPTIGVYALFVVSSDMADDTAYALTEALFSQKTRDLLIEGHPQGKNISLASAQTGISIPLHPGAQKFYENNKNLGQ